MNFQFELVLCFDTRNIYEGINMMVKTLQKYKVKTYCEHCKKEFENVWICKMDSIIGVRYALLCTCCQRLIGIYTPKDFNEIAQTYNKVINELQIPFN